LAHGVIAPRSWPKPKPFSSAIRSKAPSWQPWLLFFMRAVQQQKRRLAVKVEREKNALAAPSQLAVKILDYVRDQGRVTTRDMVRELGARANTLNVTSRHWSLSRTWAETVCGDSA
jgi:hypothetical protein